VDKAHQSDDWGVRPLSDEQIAYAAADPEWCRLVQRRLEELVVTFDPDDEDPGEVRASFLDVTARLRERKARREDIREAVTQQLLEDDRDLFGGFRLHRRLVPVTPVRELVRVADELDPGRIFEFTTAVPKALRDGLDDGGRDAVRAICASKSFRAFRGPRVPGREPRHVFPLADYDAAEVDRQYAEIDDQRRRLDSEREELRDRMRAWLERHELREWEGFRIADPEERWSADMRRLVALAPAAGDRELQVPKAFTLAFGGGVVDRLATTSRESAFVMWRERTGTRVDPQAAQSRDWQEEADSATDPS
jgi:hypothetical protein